MDNVTALAKGTFEVELKPLPEENAVINRMSIDKEFYGDLVGTSVGQMLMVRTSVEGSAGYVAMERVRGTISGRSGSFALQHNGIMDRGNPQLSVIVVPDSGTDELEGLSGEMSINVEEGKHFYEFTYSFSTV